MKHCFMNVQTNVPYYKALDLPSCIKNWFVQPGFSVYQNLQEHRSSSESLSSSCTTQTINRHVASLYRGVLYFFSFVMEVYVPYVTHWK